MSRSPSSNNTVISQRYVEFKMVGGLEPSGSNAKEKDGNDEYRDMTIIEIIENSRNDRHEEIQRELEEMKNFIEEFPTRREEFGGGLGVQPDVQREVKRATGIHETEIDNPSDSGRDEGNPMASSSSLTDLQTSQPPQETEIKHFWSRTGVGMDSERERNLLISVSVGIEAYKLKILGLAIEAMKELTKMATEKQPLWQASIDGKVLSHMEYTKQFGQVDATLEMVIRKIGMQQPVQPPNLSCPTHIPALPNVEIHTQPLQTEASRETRFLLADPVHIVELLMNNDQYSPVFSNIVSKSKVLGVLSTQAQGDYNGALQVMAVEFHAPSPLVPNRECYLARYSRCLSNNVWGVVDVSLESLFPNPLIRYQRRPSGCLIEQFQGRLCKVIWVEHSEVDNSSVPEVCQHFVTSGHAYGAKQWLSTLVRQHERLTYIMVRNDRRPQQLVPTGEENLLTLADRMMRSFWRNLSASRKNQWMTVPLSGAENIEAIIRFVKDKEGRRPGPALVMATTIRIPASSRRIFDFLQDENSRNKWDILTHGHIVQQTRSISNGCVPGNRVSVLEVKSAEDPDRTIKTLLQESFTTSDSSYVTFTPVEASSFSMILNGGDPDNVPVMPSGFSISPDGPTGDEGSLVTIVFQILDGTASPMHIPSHSVGTMYKLITETAKSITAGTVDPDNMGR
ncbi:hypothetical protein AAG906_011643 [Vitis piasezkii]